MKKAIVILALVLFLKPILPVLEYIINYDYITKVLCENKEMPKTHCNGKCYLIKELAKASENEKPISPDKKQSVQEQEVCFFQELNSSEINLLCFQNKTLLVDNYSNLYFHLNSNTVFHPPNFIS